MIENKKYIHWMALLGLVIIIGLQGVWLQNTYQSIKKDIEDIAYNILNRTLRTEVSAIAKTLPEGTKILGGPEGDSIPRVTYLYDGLYQLGCSFSMCRMDSITKELLYENNIDTHYLIRRMNPQTHEIYEQSDKEFSPSWGDIQSKIILIRLDKSQGMQLVLSNPYQYYLSRMGLLLAATAVMMLFVIFCIVWQVKILRRMSRVLRIREDFSYAMVHDLKTPLSSIIMTLRPLHEGRLDDKPALRDRYFQIARDEADHLLALTNKILTISKLENHKMHMSPEPLPLQPLLDALAERLTPKCPKPLRITADLRVPTLLADPEYWPEVMQNLVDNAIKYTRPDADAVEIHVSTRPAGRHETELRVRDNGRGISRRHLRTIFNKYERASAESNAPAQGFGLGLNFVRQVVEAHGGRIRAESEEGRWTEFIIRLPEMNKEKE